MAAKCGRINLKVRFSSFGAKPFSQLVILPNAILSTKGKEGYKFACSKARDAGHALQAN